jgi:hypothetical protein
MARRVSKRVFDEMGGGAVKTWSEVIALAKLPGVTDLGQGCVEPEEQVLPGGMWAGHRIALFKFRCNGFAPSVCTLGYSLTLVKVSCCGVYSSGGQTYHRAQWLAQRYGSTTLSLHTITRRMFRLCIDPDNS